MAPRRTTRTVTTSTRRTAGGVSTARYVAPRPKLGVTGTSVRLTAAPVRVPGSRAKVRLATPVPDLRGAPMPVALTEPS